MGRTAAWARATGAAGQRRWPLALGAGVALAATMLLPVPAPVRAETGYTTFDPLAAAPGDRVQVRVDPYNCEGWAGDRLAMRLRRDWATPPDAEVTLVRDGPTGQFRFTVPALPATRYWVELECVPGDWLGVGVNGEDPPEQFEILPPDTAVAPAPTVTGGDEDVVALQLVVFTAALVLGLRRRSRLGSR